MLHWVLSKLAWSRCQQTRLTLWKEMQISCRQQLFPDSSYSPAESLLGGTWTAAAGGLKGHLNLNGLLRIRSMNSFSLCFSLCLHSVVIGLFFFVVDPSFLLRGLLLPAFLCWPSHCFSSPVCPFSVHPGRWSAGCSSTGLHLLCFFFSLKTTNRWSRNTLKCKT